ncbi:winged helix-turn-helix domain-containing protein [Streptomyces sp. NPDC054796]
MTTAALAADSRHLRVVREALPDGLLPGQLPGQLTYDDGGEDRGARNERGTPLVGYLVLVPEGTDPADFLAPSGAKAEVRPLTYTGEPPTPPHPGDPGTPRAQGDSGTAPATPATPARKGIHIDPERHIAEVDGRALDLTYLEFELLAHLVAHPHRVHSRDHLVGTLWGYSHIGDGRTVDVHIARLRRKLGAGHREQIVTVRRVGYKYVPVTG